MGFEEERKRENNDEQVMLKSYPTDSSSLFFASKIKIVQLTLSQNRYVTECPSRSNLRNLWGGHKECFQLKKEK